MITKTLIPARGGSKTIPRKNITEINGKPLIYYAIKASLDSDVDETWVSTDDDEIAEVSQKFGASVIKRPKEICDDITMPDSALIHFSETHDFDNLVFIQPTSPLLDCKYINAGIEMIGEYDSVFSANRLQSRVYNAKLEPLNHDPKKLIKTQDLEPCFEENSCIYIFSGESFLNNKKNRIGKRPVIFEQDVNSIEVIDIDTPEDWNHAERVLMMNLAHE